MFKEELIIIRHGRSTHNIQESERLDAELTPFGVQQAVNVGGFFRDQMKTGDHQIFTSPFLRCIQTASFLDGVSGFRIKVCSDLREYINHSGREVFIPNRHLDYPLFDWSQYAESGERFHDEFNESFLHRMHSAYDQLADKSIVVTHGLPGFLLLHIATQPVVRYVPVWDYSLDNCSITVVRKGRIIWFGRNLYHEFKYNPMHYRHDWDGVTMGV